MTDSLQHLNKTQKASLALCLHDSALYPDYASWKQSNSDSYQCAVKENFTDIINSTFPDGKRRVERERRAIKKGPVSVAHSTKAKISGVYTTFGDILKKALTYDSYSEWRENEPDAYHYCCRYSWLEAVSVRFPVGKGRTFYRTKKDCLKDAMRYTSTREWREKSPAFYGRASRQGWLLDIKATAFPTTPVSSLIEACTSSSDENAEDQNDDGALDACSHSQSDLDSFNQALDDAFGDSCGDANNDVTNKESGGIQPVTEIKESQQLPLNRHLLNVALNSIDGHSSMDSWIVVNKGIYKELDHRGLASIIRHKIVQQDILTGTSFEFVKDSGILLEELRSLVFGYTSFESWASLNVDTSTLYKEFGLAKRVQSLF